MEAIFRQLLRDAPWSSDFSVVAAFGLIITPIKVSYFLIFFCLHVIKSDKLLLGFNLL